MAEQNGSAMPAASPRRRAVLRVVVLVLAAAVGAAVMYVALRPDGASPTPGPRSSSPAPVTGAGDALAACLGGEDPGAAAVAAMQAPATLDGAAQAAAGMVRFTESKAFGEPGALDVIKQVADQFGSSSLVELQKGQVPYVGKMTSTTPKVGRGAFAVTSDMPTPTVTVLTPVEWSTVQAKHYDWRFIDIKLQRLDDRWAVVSARSTVRVSDQLLPLRGADVQADDLDRYGGALAVEGFRRYSGDC
jgi:hypothetical protein